MLGFLLLKNKMTEAEARQLHRVVIEIAKEQDRRADEMVEIILRLEELRKGFSYLLEQTSQRLLERNISTLLDEETKRKKRSMLVDRKQQERWRRPA